ncbi:ASCH domain-containing protein [Acerihabitans arboris]|uniref:ASCH domain-containing protein n=1 Tax=Acerihabitans arboris TaxID=2691583 RepID=A0A845SPW7_9GAMM|nr:ASCH domain-containing protein [Acerihabitans arboris]NDL64588.1 ASCH domain-containing protein [Acerihabitans arboris]
MMRTFLTERYPDARLWAFGDSAEMADELLALVLRGEKTASCCSYNAYRRDGAPVIGGYHVVLDGRDNPACAIRTVAQRLVRYCDVTAEMAALEGEGDKSLAYWRESHQDFFTREGGFSPEMLLVFEQFEVIEVLA